MAVKRLTALEIIDETVAFYSEDVTRRATTGDGIFSGCQYLTDDGRSCAVGRCLTKKGLARAHKNEGARVGTVHDRLGSLQLRARYRGRGIGFWKALQPLHDTNAYWDTNGLTHAGIAKADSLRTIYGS